MSFWEKLFGGSPAPAAKPPQPKPTTPEPPKPAAPLRKLFSGASDWPPTSIYRQQGRHSDGQQDRAHVAERR